MIKVMIVDDERFVRMGIVNNTNWQQVGCEVVGEAENGIEGVEKAREVHPDLIVSDIRMPKMDGIEMVTKIRVFLPEVRVIYLTAYSDFAYTQQAIRQGASDYLLKPFEDGELEKAVAKVTAELQPKGAAGDEDLLPLIDDSLELNRYVRTAINYIEDHYNHPDLSIGEIAGAMNVSEGHLMRLFKKETEMSVNTYITKYRMNMAMKMLRDIQSRVNEVGVAVGYQDINYFSITFKKLVGMTPTEFKEKQYRSRNYHSRKCKKEGLRCGKVYVREGASCVRRGETPKGSEGL